MKKKYLIMIAILVTVSSSLGCQSKNVAEGEKNKYKNGTYEAKTDAGTEGFHSEATLKISNNKISDVQWKIVDQNGRVFDKTYEEVYPNSALYQQQCRSDYKGAITYSPKLIQTQDIDKVDAVSGATWSYNKFVEVVSKALDKAEK